MQGRIQGGVFGVWRPPLPQNIREAKRMMCCYKNTEKNVLFLELNVILAALKESNQYFLKGCTHHTPYTLSIKTTLVRKSSLYVNYLETIFIVQKCNIL